MVEVSHLSKKYNSKQVLTDISFTVQCKDCVAIVGNNGCGKSTLLKILSGCMPFDSGEVKYFGHPLKKDGKAARKFCGYVPQQNPLLEELSVADNLYLWENQKKNRGQVISDFDLEEILRVPVKKLSGGMQRRLSIACAVINQTPILLLDEPTAALDLHYKSLIWEWIAEFQAHNGIVIMATHDLQEIQNATKRYFMHDGTLQELSPSQSMDNLFKLITKGE